MLIKAAEPLTTSDTKTVSEWTKQMATLPQASKLATRILLLTLLFEVTQKRLLKFKPDTFSFFSLNQTTYKS